ncbi:polysaccharide biosynthesis tyrosine autokinase [Salinivibrio sp. YCSC6]|uniref:polysaccharide biosynthesis tyrosine autokinase n=1 Tax=Salinivibrio sp. YCSC6 TaxID=2003370 RepID=UPI000BBBB25F|nr:polysaccharide biosynthesis tyrosine autokinase [Salinivibrio sp. YCSC6]PCE67617.1 tyrosine-protein kinase [Salinivibrio sp. YCSC6]QCF35480.1 polysaccharide biosynthesis tyrosine autokinase [Salinivibrio sp. YCSC6]
MNQNIKNTASSDDEIDLSKLLGHLIDGKWIIVACTLLFAVVGVAFAILATPIYKADALIQVEQKEGGMSSLLGEGASGLFATDSSASTEIELIRSRMVLGQTVDKFNLTTVASPDYFPLVGKGLARLTGDQNQIAISRFEIPQDYQQQPFHLTVDAPGQYSLYNSDDELVLKGQVGKAAINNDFHLFVTELTADQGDSFTVSKMSRLRAIKAIQDELSVSERGKQTGILTLSYQGEDKALIEKVLSDIAQNYFMQNVKRDAAEAEKSLEFLKGHLPGVKAELTTAENKLNKFRQENDSVDLSLEAKASLDTMLSVEKQLNELTFKESELAQKFTKEHPAYLALLDKRQTLLGEKKRVEAQTQKLPKTQREILRLTRDVEVNQAIYVQLLNKVQELNIMKASTVGNVRIIDDAQTFELPVKPKKPLIAVIATLLGGMIGVGVVLLKAAFHRGVENPDDIEAIGLPVYASVPLSETQQEIEKKRQKKALHTAGESLLASANPADLSIEALRGLRTSLHFAMMEASNNILMFSGPSPGIGKSFVSANMAGVLAKSGQRVLVIDADMRKGFLHQQFSKKADNGLSDYLAGKLDIDGVVQKQILENLDVMTRGQVPPNPSELLMHPRFKELLDWASAHYDIVIIDTPPVLAVTDAAIVGAHAGTTLLVGRFSVNPIKEIEVTKQRFEQAGVNVKGFVLNGVVRKAASTYGGNYGYYNYSYQ